MMKWTGSADEAKAAVPPGVAVAAVGTALGFVPVSILAVVVLERSIEPANVALYERTGRLLPWAWRRLGFAASFRT